MNTSLLLYLVGGIIIGWLAEYWLDLRFWRKSNKRLQSQVEHIERRLESTSADNSTLQMHSDAAKTTLASREKEIKNLKILSRLLSTQLKQIQSERDIAIAQAKRMHTELAQYRPDFEVSDKFEPTIVEFHSAATVSERLNVAGVKTIDALGKLSDNELFSIVSSEKRAIAKGQGAWRATRA